MDMAHTWDMSTCYYCGSDQETVTHEASLYGITDPVCCDADSLDTWADIDAA